MASNCRRATGAVLGLLCLLGCAVEARPEPVITGIQPGRVSRRVDTRIVLTGEHLYGAAHVDLDAPAHSGVDELWRVQLDDEFVEQDLVTWVSPERIEFTLLAGASADTHQLLVVGPRGRSAGYPGGIDVTEEPVGLRLSVEDAADGTGQPVVAQSLPAGALLPLYAVLRAVDGQYAGSVDVSWAVSPDLGSLDPGPASESTFIAERVGQGAIQAQHAVAGEALTGSIEVLAGAAVRLALEDASGGGGTALAASTLTTDEVLELHATSRDAFGNFVANVEGQWSVDGGMGIAPAGQSAELNMDLVRPGMGSVSFVHSTLGVATTPLTVVPGRAAQLQVWPEDLSIDADADSVAFSIAGAVDADGNETEDLGTVTWSVVNGTIAHLNALTGRLDPTVSGTGFVRATSSHGALGDSGLVSIAPGQAASLTVSLPASTLSADDPAIQAAVTAADADGNATTEFGTLTWSIVGGSLSTLDAATGVLDPVSAGTAVVRVTSSLGPSGDSELLTVTPGRAAALVLSPSTVTLSADDSPLAFSATGVDADGNTTSDLGTLSWGVSSGTISAVDPVTGQLDPTTAGSGVLSVVSSLGPSATSGPITVVPGRVSVLVASPSTLAVSADDAPVAFSVSGTDAKGNDTLDLGALVWSVSAGGVSRIDPVTGVFEPEAAGSGRVRVASSHGPFDETGTISVSAGRAVSLAVAPTSVSLSADDAPFSFTATGEDADGNPTSDLGTVDWAITTGPIREIGPTTGVLDPTVAGTGTVRVSSDYGFSVDSTPVVVRPGRAASLEVTPNTALLSLDGGPSVSFAVTGTDSDGNATSSVGTLTWSVSSGNLTALDPVTGVLSPGASGSGTVRATNSDGLFADSGEIEIVAPVSLLAADPFGDGSPFASLSGFSNQIYLGPAENGSSFVRLDGDGAASESVALTIDLDGGGRNNAVPPYASLGFTGCQEDTLECGPDNEDGRGALGGGTVAGQQWLIAGPARSSGNVDLLYMTPAAASPLAMRPVDLTQVLGGQTLATTAIHVFGDRVYLGYLDSGGSRPYLLALVTMPPAAGLEATKDVDVLDFEGKDFPGLSDPDDAMIDVISDFNDRLYVANAGGWVRSTRAQPRAIDDFPGDWTVVTPNAAEYANKASVVTTKVADLLPKDRAVPAIVAFAGVLYAARNTDEGPQVWRCDPSVGAGSDCDSEDWALVAENTVADPELCQFNNPNNSAITLLAATPSALYLGYDNAVDGSVMFRSTVNGASSTADFVGEAGCSALNHPGGCSGLGGNGFGVGIPSFFDSRTVTIDGQPTLFATAGDSVGPAQLYRFLP